MTELASRNDSLGFAERTKKNLLYIEQARESGEDVHVVTQIVISSLGLIVFPWERGAAKMIGGLRLSDLEKSGWPNWHETVPSKGLGELIRKLRNAIAHGNIQFSSDDRNADNVILTFRSENGDWEATISARALEQFCSKFVEFIENTIG